MCVCVDVGVCLCVTGDLVNCCDSHCYFCDKCSPVDSIVTFVRTEWTGMFTGSIDLLVCNRNLACK